MLTIYGNSSRFCDGISRRNFLRIGALGLGGLALPQLLQAESKSGIRDSHKAVIMIYLPGGPPHQDMFDLKMDAPLEIRGEFKPIPTNVPGIQICEHLPRIARIADKLAFVRSISDAVDDHSDFHCMTGRSKRNQPLAVGRLSVPQSRNCLARSTRRSRNSSGSNQECSTSLTTTLVPGTLAPHTVPSARKATARMTWCSMA